jgi:glycosyltransferase involved in cell wall biosynthesis
LDKKRHILFLSSWYPTDIKPFLGNFVKKHIDLVSQKHFVTVIDLQADITISALQISKKSTENLTEIIVKYPKGSNFIKQWSNARKAFKLGVQSVKNVDIIHGNIILSKGLQFIWAKKHFQKPLVITEHASYFSKQKSKSWNWREKFILKSVIKNSTVFTAVSDFLKNEILHSFPNLKIEILPNVIDDLIFTLKEKTENSKTKFIHISTLDERYKNINGIIDACNILKNQREINFELEIISDENYDSIQKKVINQSLENHIKFSGPLQTSEIANKMQQSSALLLFSNYETFSCVIAEAWATGTPVISTNVGIADNMNDQLGIQVSKNDAVSLANAMRQFIDRKVTFDQNKLKEASAPFASSEVLKSIERIYSLAQK